MVQYFFSRVKRFFPSFCKVFSDLVVKKPGTSEPRMAAKPGQPANSSRHMLQPPGSSLMALGARPDRKGAAITGEEELLSANDYQDSRLDQFRISLFLTLFALLVKAGVGFLSTRFSQSPRLLGLLKRFTDPPGIVGAQSFRQGA